MKKTTSRLIAALFGLIMMFSVVSASTSVLNIITLYAQDFGNVYDLDVEFDEDAFFLATTRLVIENWEDNFFCAAVFTVNSPYMTVDSVQVEIDPNIGALPAFIDGKAMLPLLVLVDKVDGNVDFDAVRKRISVDTNELSIELEIGSTEMYVNGEQEYLEVAPFVVNDRTMVCVDTVAGHMGFEVEYNPTTMEITLTREFQTRRLIARISAPVDFSGLNAKEILEGLDDIVILQFATVNEAREAHDTLALNENVVWVEPDYFIPALQLIREDIYENQDSGITTMNTVTPLSWGVDRMGLNRYAAYVAGRGRTASVVVAVLDTGVDASHSFLAGRVLSTGRCFVSSNPNNPYDIEGHGTHVAGTVVDGTPGLNNIKILPVKVLGNNGSSVGSSVNNGIIWAASRSDVLNLSLGGRHNSQAQREAVQYAMNTHGTTVVVAAGNSNEHARYFSPASVPGVITVSATDNANRGASFTNWGNPPVDIGAPGVGINSSVSSTIQTSPNVWRNIGANQYRSFNGTSMAAPHVAAAAAMYILNNPGISPAQVLARFRSYVNTPAGWNSRYGTGILNMDLAPRSQGGSSPGTINGTVRASAGGAGVANANVTLFNISTGERRNAITQANGSYQFTGVPNGTYRVVFHMNGRNSRLSGNIVLNNNAQTVNENNFSAAATGNPTRRALIVQINGLPAQLPAGTSIALDGIQLNHLGGRFWHRDGDGLPDANGGVGSLSINIPNHTITPVVPFTVNAASYTQGLAHTIFTAAPAAPVTGGTISGTIRALSGGTGIANVNVSLFNINTGERRNTTTQTAGSYSFTGVANGTYRIFVHASGRSPVWSVPAVVNNNSLAFNVDTFATGSSVSAILMINGLPNNPVPAGTTVVIEGIGGNRIFTHLGGQMWHYPGRGFSFNETLGGIGTVRVTSPGLSFTPTSIDLNTASYGGTGLASISMTAQLQTNREITLNRNVGTGGTEVIIMPNSNAALASRISPSTLVAPSRTGHTFDGYWTAENGGNRVINASMSAFESSVTNFTNVSAQWINTVSPVTLHARWLPTTTNVTLSRPNATTSGTANFTATFNSPSTNPAMLIMPSRNGFNFDGYWTAESGGSRVINTNGNLAQSVSGFTNANSQWINTNSAVTLHARWIAIPATVTLSQPDATTPGTASFTPTVGSSATNPTTLIMPTRIGFVFEGYFVSESGGSKVINEDGTFVPNVVNFTNANGQWINTATAVTLHARWGITTNRTINLNKNGGTGGTDFIIMPGATVRLSDRISPTTELIPPTRAGYLFDGYWTAETGGSRVIGENMLIFSLNVPNFTNFSFEWINTSPSVMLYARWILIADETTVTLSSPEATTQGTGSFTAIRNYTGQVTLTMPARNGFTFSGYWTGATGFGVRVINADGTFVPNASNFTNAQGQWINISPAVTLHARWISNTTVALTPNNTTGSTTVHAPLTVTNTAPGARIVTLQAPVGNNLNDRPELFNSSNIQVTTISTTGFSYSIFLQPGEVWRGFLGTYGNVVRPDNRPIQITSAWEATGTNRVIILNPNGGTAGTEFILMPGSNAELRDRLLPTATLDNPTRAGYNFTGYWTTPTGGSRVMADRFSFTRNITGLTNDEREWINPASQVTLYAQWEPIAEITTVNLSSPNATTHGTPSFTITRNTNVTNPITLTMPTRTGYTFNGYWTFFGGNGGYRVINSDGTLGRDVFGYTDVNGNWIRAGLSLTLYAGWIENTDDNRIFLTPNITTGETLSYVPITVTNTTDTTRAVTMQAHEGLTGTDDPVLYNSSNVRIAFQNLGHGFSHTITLLAGESWNGFLGTNGNTTRPANRPIIITAVWGTTANRIINLNRNGGTGGTEIITMPDSNAVLAERLSPTEALVAPTRAGYTFDGYWTAETDGSRVINSNMILFAENVAGFTDDDWQWTRTTTPTTLFARWIPNSVNINLEFNGGTGGTEAITMPDTNATLAGRLYPAALIAPYRTGYTFDGYWTAETGGSRVISSNMTTFETNVTNFTNASAQWTRTITPTVLFARWIPDTASAVISVSNAEAAIGEIAEVDIWLRNSPGIAGTRLNVEYNPDYLRLCSSTPFKAGNILTAFSHSENINTIPLRLNFESATLANFYGDGTLITLRFEILPGALGSVPVMVSVIEAFNFLGESVNLEVSNGSVDITSETILFGDVDGNGVVNMADVFLLRRYLAGHNIPVNEGLPLIPPTENNIFTANLQAADVAAPFGVPNNVNLADVFLLRRYLAGHNVKLGNSEIMPVITMSDDEVSLEVRVSKESASPGEYVDVDVYLNANPGLVIAQFTLGFDPRLEVVQMPEVVLPGFSLTPPVSPFPNPLPLGFDSHTFADVTATGTLVTTRFRVREDAEPGELNFTLGFTDGRNIIMNFAGTTFAPSLTNAQIKITEAPPAAIVSITPTAATVNDFMNITSAGFNRNAVFNVEGTNLSGITAASFNVNSGLPAWVSAGTITLSDVTATDATLIVPLTVAENIAEARGPVNFIISNTISAAVNGELPINQVGAIARIITNANIILPVPVINETPVTVISDPGGQWDTLVLWSPTFIAVFEPETIYTAIINVAPREGFTLNGIPVNFFTVNGVTPTVGNSVGRGEFSHQFSPTGKQNIPNTITILNGGDGARAFPNPAYSGQNVVLYAGTPPEGNWFVRWASDSPGVVILNPMQESEASFIMPNNPVTITATWTDCLATMLAALIEYAEELLRNTHQSSDGSGVPKTELWTDSHARKALQDAINEAQHILSELKVE
ncbi:MAG: S8 family serine peptidase [Defluviitaleaceae bacterium]|nr:S8 family serine peptidase [Defluviitaleaceae bacterium]